MSEGDTAVSTVAKANAGDDEDISRMISGFLGISGEQVGMVISDHVTRGHILEKAREFNELQSNNMRLHAAVDEIKALCSQKVDLLNSKVDSLTRDEESAREAGTRLREQVSQLTAEKNLATDKLEDAQRELKDVREQKEDLAASKQDVIKLLDEKVSELEASKKETNDLLKENTNLRQRILEVENETQNCKSRELGDRSEMEVLKQRVALLTKSNEWLEKDVMTKTEQFIKYRKENDIELQNSLKELASMRGEFQVEKTSREFLTTKNNELSEQLQAKLLEIKGLNDSLNTERQEFSREMTLKQKLIDLLEEQVDSLQKEVRLAADSKNSKLETDDETSSRDIEREDEVTQLRQKLEASEHECIRLEAVVHDVLGETNEDKPLSPAAHNLSSSKLHGDLSVLKKQLIKERHQKESLQRQVESFIVELEYKIPFINSLKDRTAALEKELNDAALLLEHTSNEKEKATREVEAASRKIKQYESNISTLMRQRSDLARQVQFLLINVSVHTDSRGPLTDEETAFIRRLIENEDPNEDSDAQRVISERLVEFKDIVMLQQRNAELLKTVRNLATSLEEEERKTNKDIDSLENETINEAKEAIVILQEYNAKMESQLEVITKERDAYKTILSEKETAKDKLIGSESENSNGNSVNLVKELESRLSDLSADATKNIQILNAEIQSLQNAKIDTIVSLEQERSSKTLAEERLKLVQDTLEIAKKENSQLLKRMHDLQDNMSSQEMRTTETMNNYIACKSKLSVLESKVGHLEEEKSLLLSSNESSRKNLQKVIEEKNSLTIVVTQLQTLQAERENLLKDARASYIEKLDKLEQSLLNLKSTVQMKNEEIKTLEDSRNSQISWYQEKLDNLVQEEKQSREKLTARDSLVGQLREQIKDLTKRLEDGETKSVSTNAFGDLESVEPKVLHDLEKMEMQLKDAYSQVAQYKEISSAAEDSWQKLRTEYEGAKEEFDAQIKKLVSEKTDQELEISRLKENIDFLNNEYASQRNKLEEEKHELLRKIVSLEKSNKSLDCLRLEIEQQVDNLKNDLEQQATYAKIAQSNYEEELQRHADVSKTIRELRARVEVENVEMENLKASEKQARELLEANEKSWFDQKTELERELESYNQRVEDLVNQNKLLFDQIQLFSSSSPTDVAGASSPESRELLTNLRRERDILETKLAVSKRDENVLQQRLLSLEDELSELRKKYSRSQANDADQAALAQQHLEIMEQLDQMNLLRESNVTLRNALNAAQERNTEVQKELDDLQGKVVPLECEIEHYRRTINERDQEMRILREETQRWKTRSHDILRRQESIDPEEFKKLEEKVTSLQEQLEERIKENTDLDDRFNRLKKQAHEKLNASKIAQASLNNELNDLTTSKVKLEEILKEEQARVLDLQKELSEKGRDSGTIDELRSELADAVKAAKEIEETLQETSKNSEKLINQLNDEINSLKQELNAVTEGKETPEQTQKEADLSKIVESMKRAFEEEKISFVRELNQEYSKKLEEETAKINSEIAASEEREDLHELKKRWEENQEEVILKRIKEAEENLKKRIRMPTEERINKILEKRKAELEEDYQRKLNEATSQPSLGSGTSTEDLKEKLQKEFEVKYEELLGSVKKKAFEEGKQQAAMKSTLLERKISKLEAQLNKEAQSTAEPSMTERKSGLPSKIDERNGANIVTTQPPATGEKVLKLAEKPSFQFQTPSGNNPFTSGPSTNTAIEMRPTFTFPTSQPNSKPEGNVAALQQQEVENTPDSEVTSSQDSHQTTQESSPQKRPGDALIADVHSPKREKHESSAAGQ